MERTKYTVHVGGALLGQPVVRLELNDGTGRGHTFIRRKKDGATWTKQPDTPWVVDLTAKKAGELRDSGYLVVPANAEPEQDAASKRRKKGE